MEASIRFGRISGFRGNSGEVTVRVLSGHADRWTELSRVMAVPATARPEERSCPKTLLVDAARAYGGRLVLKLRGGDTPSEADAIRGFWLEACEAEVPSLPEGTYFIERLVGLRVEDELRGFLGVVEDVLETGGVEVLQVRSEDGEEILIPFAEAIVSDVDPASGTIRTRVPEGLVELNLGQRGSG